MALNHVHTLVIPLHVYLSDEGDVAVQIVVINEITRLTSDEWVVENVYAIADADTVRSAAVPAALRLQKWYEGEGRNWGEETGKREVSVDIDIDRGWRLTEQRRIASYDHRPFRLMSVWVGADKEQLLDRTFPDRGDRELRRATLSGPSYSLKDGSTVTARFGRVSKQLVDKVKLASVPVNFLEHKLLAVIAVAVDFLTAPIQLGYYAVFLFFSR